MQPSVETAPAIEIDYKTCPVCQKQVEPDNRFCPGCSYNFDELLPAPTSDEQKSETAAPEIISSAPLYQPAAYAPPTTVAALKKRYRDGYRVARTIVAFGNFWKALGVIFGVILAGIGFTAGAATQQTVSQNSFGYADGSGVAAYLIFVFVSSGVLVAASFWIFGVLVAAVGQMKRALIDSAVNTSPFLSNADRADIMSLPFKYSVPVKSDAANISKQVDLPADTTTDIFDQNDFSQPNVKASLAYGLSFLLGFVWVVVPLYLLAKTPKESRFVRFHSAQSIILVAVFALYSLFNYVTGTSGFTTNVGLLIWAVMILINFFCIWKAYQNEEFKIPVIGDLAMSFVSKN